MSDLVTELRENSCPPDVVCNDCRMHRAAADEIERLRAEVDHLENIVDYVDTFHPDCLPPDGWPFPT